jgi:hypothetical protein
MIDQKMIKFQYPHAGRERMRDPAASSKESILLKPKEVKWKCTRRIKKTGEKETGPTPVSSSSTEG